MKPLNILLQENGHKDTQIEYLKVKYWGYDEYWGFTIILQVYLAKTNSMGDMKFRLVFFWKP